MGNPNSADFAIEVVTPERRELTIAAADSLRDELAPLPKVGVGFEQGKQSPAGSKAGGIGIYETVIAVSAAGAAIPALINAIRDWMTRQRPLTTLKIKTADFEVEWTGLQPPDALLAHLEKLRRSSGG